MKTPLADAINKRLYHISFHTPAHCGVISPHDITELSYSGNLIAHSGAIKESEDIAAISYGAEHTLFVTSGATVALHTAMAIFKGGKYLVFGNMHKAVFAGLRLFAAEAFYFNDAAALEAAIQKTQPAVVIVTSPDYFGNNLDLEYISGFALRYNTPLIIDAAHGAHYAFCSNLPQSATKYGDLVIHSLHKTLPVLTGGAVLHCKQRYYDAAVFTLGELHTSSPSYPVMLSIEAAIATMTSVGQELWDNTLAAVADFSKALPLPYKAAGSDDPTRLVIESPFMGEAVAAALEKCDIFCEMSCENKVVFIVTPYNAAKLPRLLQVISNIRDLPDCSIPPYKVPVYSKPQPIIIKGGYCAVPIKDAVGKRLYKEVGWYPPAVPLFLPGHLLSLKDTHFLSDYANTLYGVDNGCVYVVL